MKLERKLERIPLNAATMRGVLAHLARELFDDSRGWVAEAVCAQVDPELFFPEKGGSTTPGKAVCRACPVRVPCLEAGMGDRFGIWGGLSERERRGLERRRGRVAS